MADNSTPTPTVDDEARENGGVKPTHNRTMAGQKAWFLQRAAAHRAAVLKSAPSTTKSAEETLAAAKADFACRSEGAPSAPPPTAPTGAAASSSPAATESQAPAASTPPPAAQPPAVDVSDSAPADGLTERLRELTIAGGDLPTLGALATRDRTELTAALKALGFKGLKTRNELEQDLKAWQAAR